MTIDTDVSQTEHDALRPRTTVECENDRSQAAGPPRNSTGTGGRDLRIVPSYGGSARIREDSAVVGSGGVGVDTAGRIGRSRATRRAEARRLRTEVRTARGDLLHREAGMATAEYAIATLAAVGFAALLVAVLSSGQIKGLLTSLITTALSFG